MSSEDEAETGNTQYHSVQEAPVEFSDDGDVEDGAAVNRKKKKELSDAEKKRVADSKKKRMMARVQDVSESSDVEAAAAAKRSSWAKPSRKKSDDLASGAGAGAAASVNSDGKLVVNGLVIKEVKAMKYAVDGRRDGSLITTDNGQQVFEKNTTLSRQLGDLEANFSGSDSDEKTETGTILTPRFHMPADGLGDFRDDGADRTAGADDPDQRRKQLLVNVHLHHHEHRKDGGQRSSLSVDEHEGGGGTARNERALLERSLSGGRGVGQENTPPVPATAAARADKLAPSSAPLTAAASSSSATPSPYSSSTPTPAGASSLNGQSSASLGLVGGGAVDGRPAAQASNPLNPALPIAPNHQRRDVCGRECKNQCHIM